MATVLAVGQPATRVAAAEKVACGPGGRKAVAANGDFAAEAKEILRLHESICGRDKRNLAEAVEAGNRLLKVKAAEKAAGQPFKSWIMQSFKKKFSYMQATKLMSLGSVTK